MQIQHSGLSFITPDTYEDDDVSLTVLIKCIWHYLAETIVCYPTHLNLDTG